jgi:hypothetical protein
LTVNKESTAARQPRLHNRSHHSKAFTVVHHRYDHNNLARQHHMARRHLCDRRHRAVHKAEVDMEVCNRWKFHNNATVALLTYVLFDKSFE